MLTQPNVQRYAVESGLRDIMIAEKEVVLTYLLQLLSQRGILDRFVFKGGTCLRKMAIGSQGRFSTDLNFTGVEEHDHEELLRDAGWIVLGRKSDLRPRVERQRPKRKLRPRIESQRFHRIAERLAHDIPCADPGSAVRSKVVE